jgi:hypothetical protein
LLLRGRAMEVLSLAYSVQSNKHQDGK